jgi:ribose-phosphate pyrophosphokinase
MKSLLFPLYCPPTFLEKLKYSNQFIIGDIVVREFPDHESYVKFNSEIKNKDIIFIAFLNRPNEKFLSLLFSLKAAKEYGAKSIGLVIPYLPYMRQDCQFSPGEAITSKYFAQILSDCIDWIVTIDPHLHRYHTLNEIYKCSSHVLHTTELITSWIKKNVSSPLLIGPDSESEQWVAAIANIANIPYTVLEKIRHGDRQVEIKFPNFSNYQELTPILVDDIISTGTTFIETITYLKKIKMKDPICIGVHAVFSNEAYKNILSAGAQKIITCNTIDHPSNTIDVSVLILDCLNKMPF